jgi:hypothetical protein
MEPEYGHEIARERAERHKHIRHWQASKSHLLMTPLRGGILPSAKTRLSRQVNSGELPRAGRPARNDS